MRTSLERSGGDKLLVLGWHNVEGSWCFPSSPGAGRRGLAQQLRGLRRLANVVPLDAALRDLAEGRPLPARAVAITFDDGYRDTLTLAAPLLHELGLDATVFLVPEILSAEVNPWWERLAWAFGRSRAEAIVWDGQQFALHGAATRRRVFGTVAEQLKRRNHERRQEAVEELVKLLSPEGADHPDEMFLDWDGARQLVREGLAIGSHSMRHAILTEEPPEAQRADLAESRRLLEDQLQVGVRLLAYPNGTRRDYDGATIAAAHAAGYTRAITAESGWNRRSTRPYEIRRVMMQAERGVPGLAIIARELLREVRNGGRPSSAVLHAGRS